MKCAQFAWHPTQREGGAVLYEVKPYKTTLSSYGLYALSLEGSIIESMHAFMSNICIRSLYLLLLTKPTMPNGIWLKTISHSHQHQQKEPLRSFGWLSAVRSH